MVKSFGSALTALGLIGALGACANPSFGGPRSASIFGDKVDQSNIGIATRAQAALEKGDHAAAISLAERAVDNSPRDAGFRALLGNAYFAAGRFASAESAYRDSLTLFANQPQLILKLALVGIAQGKSGEAIAQLDAARDQLDPADYGLALALAGQPQMASAVLEQASRDVGADARVRQNLALAFALQGEWTAARTIAAQDLPADEVDARVQQWMAFAKPERASDQVAALTGVTPAPVDPGQPMRLALAPQAESARMAYVEPAVAPVAQSAPVAFAEPAETQPLAPVASPVPAPVEYAAIPAPQPAPKPVKFASADPVPVAAASKPKRTAAKGKADAKPGLSPRATSLMHKASFPQVARGNSKSVVQLGAYNSRDVVGTAWSKLAKKYPALRGYTPSSARFESAKGTVYRLSLKGFASDGAAREFCEALQQAGGACFVRTVAGDAPVRLAAL